MRLSPSELTTLKAEHPVEALIESRVPSRPAECAGRQLQIVVDE
jgi:hypothetical protein